MKAAATYRGRLGKQSEFSLRYACWAQNHGGRSKAKRRNKRTAKRRIRQEYSSRHSKYSDNDGW